MTDVNFNMYELMAIRSASAFVEVIGGQPLDRLKVNRQLPLSERLSFKELTKKGIREFYAASTTSVIQRCFFYVPALYMGCDYYDRNLKVEGSATLNAIGGSFFSSLCVSPCVSAFENLKTEQQLGRHKDIRTMRHLARMIWLTQGMKGLFPSLTSTFFREAAFAGGVCYLSGAVYNFLDKNTNVDSNAGKVIGAGIVAGTFTQVITQPFDTIKTWQENKKTSFGRSVRDILRGEGALFLFNGMAPRVMRGMWTFSCLYYCTREFSAAYRKIKLSIRSSSGPTSLVT